MNLKKTLLSFMAAGAILAGGFGGVTAQTSSSHTTGTVQVTGIGSFNAQFCGAVNFGNVDIDSHNAATATATSNVEICYTDTLNYRGTFRTYMQAGNFNGNGFNIPASGLSPTWIYNVASGQWGGTYGDNNYVGGIGAMKGAANYASGPGGYVNGISNEGLWVGGNLSESQYVGYGNAGIGTGGTMYKAHTGGNEVALLEIGSVAKIGLELEIPSNTPSGTFVSDFTLNVNPATP